MKLIYSGDQPLFNEVFILPPYSLFLYELMLKPVALHPRYRMFLEPLTGSLELDSMSPIAGGLWSLTSITSYFQE